MTTPTTCCECRGPLPTKPVRRNRLYCSEACRRSASRLRRERRNPAKALEQLRAYERRLAARMEWVRGRILEVRQLVGKGGVR